MVVICGGDWGVIGGCVWLMALVGSGGWRCLLVVIGGGDWSCSYFW